MSPTPEETAILAKIALVADSVTRKNGEKHFRPQDGDGGIQLNKHQQSLLDLLTQAKTTDWDSDSRGALRQRMLAKITPEEKAAFKTMKNAEKDAFAKKWNKAEHEQLTVCSQTDEWRKVDITDGKYMSATKIFQEEGGTEADLEPTCKLLEKNLRMGFPFTKYNEFTERLDHLYFRRGYQETMTKSWKIFRDNSGQAEGEDAEDDKDGENVNDDGGQTVRQPKRLEATAVKPMEVRAGERNASLRTSLLLMAAAATAAGHFQKGGQPQKAQAVAVAALAALLQPLAQMRTLRLSKRKPSESNLTTTAPWLQGLAC